MRTTRCVAIVLVALGLGLRSRAAPAEPEQELTDAPQAAGASDKFRSFAELAGERTEGST